MDLNLLQLALRVAHPRARVGLALTLTLIGCSEPKYADDDEAAADAMIAGEPPEEGDAAQSALPDAFPDAGSESTSSRRDGATGRRDVDGATDAGVRTPDATRADASVPPIGGGDDAARPAEPPDAAAPSTLPAWAQQLVGSYAVQLYAFSDDGYYVSQSEGLMIAEIRREGDALQMVTQNCKTVAINSLATITVRKPETFPTRRHRVHLAEESFSTEPIEVAEGYAPEQIPECVGKLEQMIDKRPHQTWLTSSCRCSADLIPKADDCRTLDPDGDMRPGYTMHFRTASGLTQMELWGAGANYSRFVAIEPGPERSLQGRMDAKTGALQYGCSADCADLSGPTPWCPSDVSQVKFVHLGSRAAPPGGWNCEAVRVREGEVFPDLQPQVPTRCGR